MKRYFGCDAHKRYSIFTSVDEKGNIGPYVRVENQRSLFRGYLGEIPPRSQIAVETVGNWYWMVDDMEQAGHIPLLTNAGKAKAMMGQINKTDKLDAKGLALLLRNGTLPSIWIPPGGLRDQRELPRMRMTLVRIRTMLKNRIHATLSKYAIEIDEVCDVFGVTGRRLLEERIRELPPQTHHSVEKQLELLDDVEDQIKESERQIKAVVRETPAIQFLMTLPGVGMILAIVIAMEVGDVARFCGADRLASYAGTVPRIKASGGKIFLGRVRPDVNRYLKWAFIEAANTIVLFHKRWTGRHVVSLYMRLREKRGHAKAVVAVARHLAEATYWVLKKGESYRERNLGAPVSSTRE
jgi:transposase